MVKTEHIKSAFDGEGAFRFGGRWNSRGQRVVYASGSLSLATLEILVHIDPAGHLPKLSAFSIDLPVKRLQVEDYSKLDHISGGLPWHLGQTRAWGDAWRQSQTTPALQVPSSIVPHEQNYLLNPSHPSFDRLTIGEPQDFSLDSRLN
ncbi:Unannotated [Lentimonas sp. CC4]|nr:Unannotated [Lentimonas sp. CC4]CAA6687090.1 Unannotated [Lentimonas sp. CC6]CAA7075562.1 Unannotated [Lentimonas sp. CC4]CAA7170329.1 Unannotated [Lentimonas sp. CC21]CAA7182623.1 Unannotated [Lentimonas sp. CC8]